MIVEISDKNIPKSKIENNPNYSFVSNGTWLKESNNIIFMNDEYIKEKKSNNVYIPVISDVFTRSGVVECEIWGVNTTGNDSIIIIDNKVTAMKIRNIIDVTNIMMSIDQPEQYLIAYEIRKNKKFSHVNEKKLENVRPVNSPISLDNINRIPRDPFVTIKMDGITSIIGFIEDHGIFTFDLKWNPLWHDTAFKPRKTKIFLGEYLSGRFYLFMEANEKIKTFASITGE